MNNRHIGKTIVGKGKTGKKLVLTFRKRDLYILYIKTSHTAK